jgi:uncharacterized protein (DUF2252 family)
MGHRTPVGSSGTGRRRQQIVDVLEDAFADLMEADPHAFRTKYRKMAADPFAFYRGTACLFYADVSKADDRWADDQTSRVWIHGDLHAENFGTYMNSHGTLVFDVNDFDEAYLGHFTWDLRRLTASFALLGWQKALPEGQVREILEGYLRAYLDQVRAYVDSPDDSEFALRLDNAEGAVHDALEAAREASRLQMLETTSYVVDHQRRFLDGGGNRRLGAAERSKVLAAYRRYLDTIPDRKRQQHESFYDVLDVVGKAGFGIGSAGLPAYNVLLEGFNQAHENDVILAMKQASPSAVSRHVDLPELDGYFEHEGHRTTVSQRALQMHADPLLGYTTIDDVGFVVSELSPYEADLEWGELNEPEEMAPVLAQLGRATAKIHCASDADSDEALVKFQTEEAIAEAVGDKDDEFVKELCDFATSYAEQTREDHALFVEAFRSGDIGGVTSAG